ncbi:unnamed protein product [Rhizoctonia solani]|uniref:Uncharacterized protein n=1 Tax=Rhizoctonia solani TaxID=456999 RepID=A0A8H3HSS4_9AGAM|nr:unnamed protein product [Rhizoctonia solani]
MSSTTTKSAECSFTYNADGQLLTVVVPRGAINSIKTYTFTTNNKSQRPQTTWDATLLYSGDQDTLDFDQQSTKYEFRTSSDSAAISIGVPDNSSSQVVMLMGHRGVMQNLFEAGQGLWTAADPPAP